MENKKVEKTLPNIGDELYLRQFTGRYYVDIVKRPYTLIAVTPTKVTVQEAQLIYPVFKYDPSSMSDYYKQFDGQRVAFYDTVAEFIVPDPTGRIQELVWHSKRGLWGTPGPDSSYPEYAIIGKYEHQPYLD